MYKTEKKEHASGYSVVRDFTAAPVSEMEIIFPVHENAI